MDTVIDETHERIKELSHSITFYFKKGEREFRLTIKVDRNNEGKVEIEEQNDEQPILIASDSTNWVLYEKLMGQARGVFYSVCQYADKLANEYIK